MNIVSQMVHKDLDVPQEISLLFIISIYQMEDRELTSSDEIQTLPVW